MMLSSSFSTLGQRSWILLSVVFIVGALGACTSDKDDDPTPLPGTSTTANTITVPCADIQVNTTWANVEPDSSKFDYIVACQIDVMNGVLTIAPGVRIRFDGPDASLRTEGSGGLNASGTAAQPITFESGQMVRGAWAGLRFNSRNADNMLSYARIWYAGSKDMSFGAQGKAGVVVYNTGRLKMTNSRIETCAGHGIVIDQSASFPAVPEFSGNTISGCELHPVVMTFKFLSAWNDTNRLTNNGKAGVRIYLDALAAADDVHVPNLGVPLEIATSVELADGDLTLDPGVTMAFAPSAYLKVRSGTLTAVGTASAPITLQGQQAGQGTWIGLHVAGSGLNRMEYCTVDGGGNARAQGSAGMGGVVVGISSRAGRLSLANCIVRNSFGFGIHKAATTVFSATGMTYANNQLGDVGTY
ncbi:MAG: right-handed parallel beta-helix repeat-containing protein [Hymenobacteraceae bacterium]|nr:right-handed parallel beta-helix repeat-containing protein [Hymenobacteraceae bacterium]